MKKSLEDKMRSGNQFFTQCEKIVTSKVGRLLRIRINGKIDSIKVNILDFDNLYGIHKDKIKK
jgi:hypothetical protein